MADMENNKATSKSEGGIMEEEYRDWSALPEEILDLISSYLYDIRPFHWVCRSWHAIKDTIKSRSQWLFHKPCDKSNYYFFHPLYEELEYTQTHENMIRAVPRYSRDGWILMSLGERSMLFFNPLTNVVIRLPDLLLLAHGKEQWVSCVYDNNLPFIPSSCTPVFHNHMAYCLGVKGNLGVYDLAEDKWTVLDKPQQPCRIAHENYLVYCEGEILSVFMGRLTSWISVFKLDESNMTWEKIYTLGDYALFVSIPTSFSTRNIFPHMKNKIFFPFFHDDCIVYYSFDTQKFHTFGGKLCNRDLCCEDEITEQIDGCWIEPNTRSYPEKDLKWLSCSKDHAERIEPNTRCYPEKDLKWLSCSKDHAEWIEPNTRCYPEKDLKWLSCSKDHVEWIESNTRCYPEKDLMWRSCSKDHAECIEPNTICYPEKDLKWLPCSKDHAE